ncbi:AAA family ATPase [Devosia sp.]|uniref:AAA family ATPase n=1 Tax=Devosia sp. TaxID=1871048 RepID=UPI001AD12368|nr:AAA family ATPase [Devosia sp.]MBN9307742.1 AAA family ATPase [Devosia sp.]
MSTELPTLESLGPRIMICGPSNAGKSTLAVALARKLDAEPYHVDLFRHLPGTDWVQRPDEEFAALHDAAIREERWVMDGNYSSLMPQRFARATGIILLGDNRWANFRRYLWRTLFQRRSRPGSLSGDRDSIKWGMMRWILIVQPPKREQDRARLRAAGLPMVELGSMAQLNRLYRAWGLERRVRPSAPASARGRA